MDVREKLVEQAISHFWYGISHDIFSEPVTTYAKLAIEAFEKEKNCVAVEWISVRDRLPDTEDVFLCWSKDLADMMFCYTSDFQQMEVTHWMPLPPAPKEEK